MISINGQTWYAIAGHPISQGFGTRRVCCGLIQQGHVRVWPAGCPDVDGIECLDPLQSFEPLDLWFSVNMSVGCSGACIHTHAQAHGHRVLAQACSAPSIYTLLPPPLRQRPGRGAISGVQAVGRLDQDTTGMLVLSDDGQFIHMTTSPKKRCPSYTR
jgi:16S rRNA pseudouridine516 synthase